MTEREYWWFRDADGEFIMRRTGDGWDACGNNINADGSSTKQVCRVLTPEEISALECGLTELASLNARVKELEALALAQSDLMARPPSDALAVRPERNSDGEHLSCIVCDHGHEELGPAPEWLVTVRGSHATYVKGLHEACWRRTAKIR